MVIALPLRWEAQNSFDIPRPLRIESRDPLEIESTLVPVGDRRDIPLAAASTPQPYQPAAAESCSRATVDPIYIVALLQQNFSSKRSSVELPG